MNKQQAAQLAHQQAGKVGIGITPKKGTPVIKPGTAIHTFIWQGDPQRPNKASFAPGPYWVRHQNSDQCGILYLDSYKAFIDRVKPGMSFCGPIPVPQDIKDGVVQPYGTPADEQ